jgi:hypothetical protein
MILLGKRLLAKKVEEVQQHKLLQVKTKKVYKQMMMVVQHNY